MSTPAGPATEQWTYGGLRVGKGGKRRHAWLDPGGAELLFSGTGSGAAIGSHYTARVTRDDDGAITLHGTPEYAGTQAGEPARRALWAADTLARTQLETLRAERDDARRNALDEAITPLLEVAAPLRTSAQRDALAAYVIRKLHSTWGTR